MKKTILVRIGIVALSLVLWFWTQSLIGARPVPTTFIGDQIHAWTTPLHSFLETHASFTNGLLIASSLLIDLLGLFLIGFAIFGPSMRPFYELIVVFVLRQICQGLVALPPPTGMLWHDPGFPSLLVTYSVASDFFFSGHTAIAVLGAIELARLKKKWLSILGIAIVLFEISTVLLLRSHYTLDVFTGALCAICVGSFFKYEHKS